ncbi:NAD-dependent epimerase/dehydratase family protein [Aeromicrobium fastidiosum]|uniref:NAD(P)-dependent oxidoreductase n=1 Tax=Aeromicrobium fastidiosum TaxID=52699 RepID=A0A641ANM8_9ACTN|nr:NAD(P)-dependent oxidoreductase [Aeromicrobium fastidiosum]KAA1379690.1 NAD(P)-dependent oxidoreductase [Aeromicrobium fastidiosum]MBP2389171.1 nucleoside-diphosphate-sugar epimerase [Aeromicrobium fastidiosum]
MKVFLTGASGVMGRSSIDALHRAGHDVVGLARSQQAADVIAAAGAKPVPGDIYDRPAMTAGMRGCDAVANLATKVPVGSGALRPGSLKKIDRIRLHGSRIVAEAALRAGVGRLVQQSLSFIYADHGDDWLDEHSPVDVTRATEPVVVAEDNVKAFAAEGGTAVSLRFGLITGDDPNTAWLFRRAAAGRSIGLGDEKSWMHLIHTDDVGTAVVHALGAPGGTYNVGAEPVQRRDYVDMIALAAGRRSGGHFLPPWILRLGAEKLEILVRSQRVSSQLFSDRTGWHPDHPKLTPDWFDDLVRA